MKMIMQIPRPFLVMLLFTACLLSGSGCGGTDKVVSVSGKVTHNGQPVAGLIVSFVPQAATESGVSTGTTNGDGEYKLTVVKTGSRGAVVGTHKVWVSLPREPPEPFDKEDKMKMSRQRKKGTPATEKPQADLAAILRKYGNLDKTPLTVEVKGGEPIDLRLD